MFSHIRMAGLVPLKDWETGVQVGWWQDIGPTTLEEGLEVDFWPWQEVEGEIVPLAWHRHPEGYWWLRLPGGGKVLWHRQLWMDRNGRRLERGEEVHHRDHRKGNNKVHNLEMVLGRDHRRHHGRMRRARLRW
jgi:hypothetical protein